MQVEPDDYGGAPPENYLSSGDEAAEDIVDELPPGWTKEVKYRRKGNYRKRDTNYIDPKRMYVFKSLKDVSRYLENGDINSCCSRPRKIMVDDFHATREDNVQGAESKEESPGEAVKERISSIEKIEGASKGTEHGTKLTPASKGSSRPAQLTSVNMKQEQEKVDTETYSTSLGDSAEKTDSVKLMYPKKHGKRSARRRGKNSMPSVPHGRLLNSEISKHENDQNVSPDKKESNQVGNTPCRASESVQNLKENSGKDADAELLATKVDMSEYADSTKSGKRSVLAKGKKSASCVPQDGLENFERELSKHGNDQKASQNKTKSTDGGTTTEHASKRIAETKAKHGADIDVVEQTDVQMVDDIAEMKESIGAEADIQNGVPMADTVADTNSFEIKDKSHAQANAVDLSSAESALASLYGESERDVCIEFAVKLLMNEIPLPKEAGEVEEFFSQKMNKGRNKNEGPSRSQEISRPINKKNRKK